MNIMIAKLIELELLTESEDFNQIFKPCYKSREFS
jgi:hypothetical protein